MRILINENINSDYFLKNREYYFTKNGRMLKKNFSLKRNDIIEMNYRLLGGIFVDSDSNLSSAINTSQTIQLNKGNYSDNYILDTLSTIDIEILGGYSSENNFDSTSGPEDTVINGNLSIKSQGKITLKNIKVNGNININGNSILIENIENTKMSTFDSNLNKINESINKFNDAYFYGLSELLGNTTIITNGIHFCNKLKCGTYNININKRNDSLQPTIDNTLADPDDTYYFNQYAIETSKISDAWKCCNFNSNQEIIVAVIDTGVDINHPDIVNNLYKNADGNIIGIRYNRGSSDYLIDDDNGHGTHVAGIIAAETGNNIGISGISKNNKIKIMPIKVINNYSNETYGYNIDIALGIDWAVSNGAHIINLSLGGDEKSYHIHKSINNAFDKGCIIVSAAGNVEGFVEFPAAYANTICVGAVDQYDDKASFSNWKISRDYPQKPEGHYGVDIMAPGVSLVSTYDNTTITKKKGIDDSYLTLSGTSMSTPMISGIIALFLQQNPNYIGYPNNVRKALLSTSYDLGDLDYDNKHGYGMVDAKALLLFPWTTSIYDSDDKHKIISNSDFIINGLTKKTENIFYDKNLEPDPKPRNNNKKKSINIGLISAGIALFGFFVKGLSKTSKAIESLTETERESDYN
jgi:subtilisin family serine protease